MSVLANYDDLKAEIGYFIDSPELVGRIPTFIRLCETQLNRKISHRRMMQIVNFTWSGDRLPLPDDFNEPRSLYINTTSGVQTPKYVTPEVFDSQYITSGDPYVYTIIGDYIFMNPAPDDATEGSFRYLQDLPALSDFGTNWCLDNFPDAYLYGSLLQAETYLKGDARLPVWRALYQDAIDGINDNGTIQQFGATVQTQSGQTVF